ncbi:MAG: hypothetical protein IJT76_07340 [Clostridia bacterium]|nr:hypothetical protein [Clostridia bacterium]
MKKHGKKMVAPIVITALILLYYAAMGCVILLLPGMKTWLRLALVAVPLIPCCVILYVMIQRIGEIKKGEEDDLDQY